MDKGTRIRRRWLWLVLAVVVLLLGGQIAWRLRPLNSTERSLVGIWRPIGTGTYHCLYRADRTFAFYDPSIREIEERERYTLSGVWHASEGELHERPNTPSWEMTPSRRLTTDPLRWYAQTFRVISLTLRIEGHDRIWIVDQEFVRVPE